MNKETLIEDLNAELVRHGVRNHLSHSEDEVLFSHGRTFSSAENLRVWRNSLVNSLKQKGLNVKIHSDRGSRLLTLRPSTTMDRKIMSELVEHIRMTA
ncbi:MAG: hypothetical protein ABH863_06275 [Candidatus Micrarchaeota archaeon]